MRVYMKIERVNSRIRNVFVAQQYGMKQDEPNASKIGPRSAEHASRLWLISTNVETISLLDDDEAEAWPLALALADAGSIAAANSRLNEAATRARAPYLKSAKKAPI